MTTTTAHFLLQFSITNLHSAIKKNPILASKTTAMHRSKPSSNEQAKSGYCHRATNSSGSISAFNACVVNSSDYYTGAWPAPCGSMQMPGRRFSAEEYRWGFNGMEKSVMV